MTQRAPIKGQFWDQLWPALQAAGWTSDLTPCQPSGCLFFPPPDAAGGQLPPLESIQVGAA